MHISSNQVINTLLFQDSHNTSLVMISSILLGIVCSIAGTFLILRKRSLMSDGLSHATLPGICLAFFLLAYQELLPYKFWIVFLGALLSSLIALGFMNFLSHKSKLGEETIIGITIGSFFGLGVVLMSILQYQQNITSAGLMHFLLGQPATLRIGDLYNIIILSGLILLLFFLFYKEFLLLCFDALFAKTNAFPIQKIDFLMSSLLCFIIIIGLNAVGILLIIALLIIPAASARLLSNSVPKILLIASGIGAVSCYIGVGLSAITSNMPTGSTIILTNGIFFICVFLKHLLSKNLKGVV